MPVLIRALVLLILTATLSGCGYNAIQQKEEGVKAGWAEVLNQYQRRADLIPNLVRTVQGLRPARTPGADRSDQCARARARSRSMPMTKRR